jgi:gluconokinase
VVLARANRLIAAMATSYPTLIPGLRSPHDLVGGLVYFGRMLDKIRLSAADALPADWQAMRGSGTKGTFDWRCCEFLQLDYAALEAETLKGDKDDAALLEWAFQHGRRPSEQEIEVWNAFMSKRGWRDAGTPILHKRLADIGLPPGTVETMFEFLDLDEGRRTV